MKIATNIKLITIALASLVATSAFAVGFGVAGNQKTVKPTNYESAAVMKLLSPESPVTNRPVVTERQLANHDERNDGQQTRAVQQTNAAQQKEQQTFNQHFGRTGVTQQAFANTVRNMMPLSPNQIKTLRKMFNKSQQAATTYPGTPPRPTSRSIFVSLAPGSTPPIVRLRQGFVTSLVFLDSTGQPWPIEAEDLGNPKAFNVQWNRKGNTLLVQALERYKAGNLAVMLKGEDTPIMVTLMPGQQAVDYSVQLRVPGMGPNAKPQFSGLPSSTNPVLLNFLDGVPPSGSKTLTVYGGGRTQAWEYQHHVFLRTRLTVISPSWLGSMSSPSGMHVFEMTKAPIVLASFRGKIVRLKIKGI